MASCALNYLNARHGGQEPLNAKQSALKSFIAQLAMHYPAYNMVICQDLKVKAVNDVSQCNIWPEW